MKKTTTLRSSLEKRIRKKEREGRDRHKALVDINYLHRLK